MPSWPLIRPARVQHERLADGLNAHWIQRYQAEVG